MVFLIVFDQDELEACVSSATSLRLILPGGTFPSIISILPTEMSGLVGGDSGIF